MNNSLLFQKTQERTFFAHHMLLHAAQVAIAEAEATERDRFDKCLAAMAMTALAVEGLANAVGSCVVGDWPTFERLRPHEKINLLIEKLHISRNTAEEPWTTLQFLGGFRNDIAHPKPEAVIKECVLPAIGLAKTAFHAPLSTLEREITVGNAKRVYAAVHELKGLFADALSAEARFGIYADMWHGCTTPHEV
ncbi:MAG: hypothetical protein ABI648_09420 [Betaproteobacteria bacterium]|jgi:hypothetical protein